jgi:hypothetical protein
VGNDEFSPGSTGTGMDNAFGNTFAVKVSKRLNQLGVLKKHQPLNRRAIAESLLAASASIRGPLGVLATRHNTEARAGGKRESRGTFYKGVCRRRLGHRAHDCAVLREGLGSEDCEGCNYARNNQIRSIDEMRPAASYYAL